MLELSPYFKSLTRTPKMCPECHAPIRLNPLELTWDGAMWKCDACGWCQLELAPEAAKLGPRRARANVIEVDFGKSRK